MKKKNQDDQFKDLYHFYKTSGEAKKIMVRNFPDLLPEFEKLIVNELDEKKKTERKKEIVEKETEIDHCICDYDIDCKYCEDQLNDENQLYADAINTGTELEEQEFVQKELNAIRNQKRIDRKKKRKEKTDEANYLSMLDDRLLHCSELSCYISVKISKPEEESDSTKKAAEKPKEENYKKMYHDLKFLAAIGGLFMALLVMLFLFLLMLNIFV